MRTPCPWLYYYHYDAQGDVNVVTDASGNVYRQYFYDPYGNVIKVLDGTGNAVDINNDTGFNNAYTYRGYRYDPETGLYFLNARYYAAGIGRFLTKDIVLGHLSDPQSLNRYEYCGGDPVNQVDPDGHFAFLAVLFAPEIVAAVSVVATAIALEASAIINEASMFFSTYGPEVIGAAQNVSDKVSGESDSGGGNNSSGNNNEPEKPDYKKYDPKQIEKKYDLQKGQFHQQVKKDILSDVAKQAPKELRRLGDNPDIELSQDGQVRLTSRTNNYSFEPGLNIKDYIMK